jgi:hypothetical protein
MNWTLIAKFVAGAGILGSVFALVWVGKEDAQVYIGLASGTLAGLGILASGGTTPKV